MPKLRRFHGTPSDTVLSRKSPRLLAARDVRACTIVCCNCLGHPIRCCCSPSAAAIVDKTPPVVAEWIA